MPFLSQPLDKMVEEVQQQTIQPFIEITSNSEKFDVMFVIMVVLLMFTFSRLTSIIFKVLGSIIIAFGLYTLIAT
jgi:hypothetical protein